MLTTFAIVINLLIVFIITEVLKLVDNFFTYLADRKCAARAASMQANSDMFAYGAAIHDAMLNGFVADQAAAAVLGADEYFNHLEQLDWLLNTNGIRYHDE